MIPLIYLIAKLAAYTLWAWVGLNRFRAHEPSPAWKPLAVALVRIVGGLLLALPMWMASTAVFESLPSRDQSAYSEYVVYAVVYAVFRWLAWSAVAPMVFAETRGVRVILLGAHTKDRCWRLGGILISFILDLPLLAELGGPMVGKFFC